MPVGLCQGGTSFSAGTRSWLPRPVQPGSWHLHADHPPPLTRTQRRPPLPCPQRVVPSQPHAGPGGAALFTHSHLGPAALEECGEGSGHICRRHLCLGRQKASMAVHECGFCLACLAGTQALRAALSQDRGCEQAARDGMSPSCPGSSPPIGGAEERGGGCCRGRPPAHPCTHVHTASLPGWPGSLGSRRAWKGTQPESCA